MTRILISTVLGVLRRRPGIDSGWLDVMATDPLRDGRHCVHRLLRWDSGIN